MLHRRRKREEEEAGSTPGECAGRLLHRYTATPLHRYTGTLVHCYTATPKTPASYRRPALGGLFPWRHFSGHYTQEVHVKVSLWSLN